MGTLEYRSSRPSFLVRALVIFILGITGVIISGLVQRHWADQEAAYRAAIPAERLAQLDATRESLKKAPYLSIVYLTREYRGQAAGTMVLGKFIHDPGNAHTRIVRDCESAMVYGHPDEFDNLPFLIRVEAIVSPGSADYAKATAACVAALPMGAPGSRLGTQVPGQ